MKVKIKAKFEGGGWFMRRYLWGRSCEVLAVQNTQLSDKTYYTTYFVLHPVTKKPGYWLSACHAETLDELPEPPTWEEFLRNNKYGYKPGS